MPVSKYRAIPTLVDGIRFASKAEAARYSELKLLQQAGQVRWFIRQPSFDLPAGLRYVADFLVVWEDGTVAVEDVKGMETDVFKMKRKLFEEAYQNLTIVRKGRAPRLSGVRT